MVLEGEQGRCSLDGGEGEACGVVCSGGRVDATLVAAVVEATRRRRRGSPPRPGLGRVQRSYRGGRDYASTKRLQQRR